MDSSPIPPLMTNSTPQPSIGLPHPLEGSPEGSLRLQSTKESMPAQKANPLPDDTQDEALQLLSQHLDGPVNFNADDDNRLLRKIDKHLMPIMFTIYFLQLMDKQTLAFSSVFGIIRDADLVGDDYSLLGSIVYIAQLIAQPLSAYLLVRLRLSIYVPVIVTCWGATLTCMAAAKSFPGLLVSRYFLGTFEASIQAAFIIITQMWYRRREQGIRIAIWYSNNGWVNMIGSLIMYGIGHIHSKVLHPYQVIFLTLGSITFIVGLLSFWLFPGNPVRCRFLTTEEKIMTIERCRANQQGVESKQFKMPQFLEMILDIKSWFWALLMFCVSLPMAGTAIFGPLILRGFGFDKLTVMLLMIPYGAVQVISISLGFWASNYLRLKAPIILIALIPCIVSATLLLVTGRSHSDQRVLLTAYYLLATQTVLTPTIMGWQSANVAGHTKKTTSTTMMLVGLMVGSMAGPLLFVTQDQPYYRRGMTALLSCFCATGVLVVLLVIYLSFLNAKKRRSRIARGKLGEIVDHSLLTSAEIEQIRKRDGEPSIGQQAFQDLTDLQNDEFVYVF